VVNCGRGGQATSGNIIRHMRFACWINKVTNTPSEYAIFYFISTTTIVMQTRCGVTL